MSDCEPVDVAARLLCPWDSRGRDAGVGCHSLLQGIFPTQRSNPGLPHCRQILLPTEPPWKPKKTGVGSLSLLQRIFLTQESNQGLLHCKRILYQLSYWGRMGHRSKGKMQNNPEKLQKSSHEQTCTVQWKWCSEGNWASYKLDSILLLPAWPYWELHFLDPLSLHGSRLELNRRRICGRIGRGTWSKSSPESLPGMLPSESGPSERPAQDLGGGRQAAPGRAMCRIRCGWDTRVGAWRGPASPALCSTCRIPTRSVRPGSPLETILMGLPWWVSKLCFWRTPQALTAQGFSTDSRLPAADKVHAKKGGWKLMN